LGGLGGFPVGLPWQTDSVCSNGKKTMHRQDNAQSALSGETPDQINANESNSLGRRRALLAGLGKGGALVAAAAPISSFAVGRVKTPDGKQCTVSGQMSAVMSQAASSNPCAAFHPTYFFQAETLEIASLPLGGLRTALEGLLVGRYTSRSDGEYFKRSDSQARKLTPLNRPAGYSDPALKVSDILSVTGSMRVLRQLHGRPNSDEVFFLAAFFSAALAAPGGAEKVPFPDTDVKAQWTGTHKAAAAALYRLICTVGMDTSKLG
jgi:hypothetical protein